MNFIHGLDYMGIEDMHPYILMLAFIIGRSIKMRDAIEHYEKENYPVVNRIERRVKGHAVD